MVLTQLPVSSVELALKTSFHTTMVLTQLKAIKNYVAILSFPYHYGSHATTLITQKVQSGTCFHTTMVHTRAVLR